MQKKKVMRSKMFMKWVHENTKGDSCCICKEEPWVQLHHFGSDGGKGMKPSDNYVCRLCRDCALKFEIKTNAMQRDGKYELLSSMLSDAVLTNGLYIDFLESKMKCNKKCFTCEFLKKEKCFCTEDDIKLEPECAIDELNEFLISVNYDETTVFELRDYYLEWANRRAANVVNYLIDCLVDISSSDGDGKFVAMKALEFAKRK